MSGFASFLVGMGGGYIKARDKEYDRERQAKADARLEQTHQWLVDDRAAKEKLTTDLAAANAPRTTMNGTLVEGAGNKVFAQSPEIAGVLDKTLSDEAELRGMAPATTSSATGVVAQGAKLGHQITTGPVDVTKLNSPEDVASRTAAAYTANGRPMEAMDYQSRAGKLAEEQRVRMKLLEKEGVGEAMSFLSSNNPDAAMVAYQKSGDMKLPEGSKFVQVDGTDIFTKKPGKVWSVIGPDGKTILDDVGGRVAKFLGIEGQLGIDKDIRTAEAAAVKAALEERKVAALERNAATNEMKLDGLLMRGTGGGGSASRSGQADVQQPSMPDPMSGFDSKKAQAVALEIAQAELANGPTPAKPKDISGRAIAIYRSLEDEFKKTGLSGLAAQAFAQSARNAATPNDVAALYQQGLSHGMSPSQMAEIDPRMAPLANPPKQETKKKDPAKPSAPARPLTTFESMRQNKLAEEAANRKSREQSEKEAREAERQRLLMQRPDLQQMGGMRFFN